MTAGSFFVLSELFYKKFSFCFMLITSNFKSMFYSSVYFHLLSSKLCVYLDYEYSISSIDFSIYLIADIFYPYVPAPTDF